MIDVSYDCIGRSECYFKVSGKIKLHDKSFDEVNFSLRAYLTVFNFNLSKITERKKLS